MLLTFFNVRSIEIGAKTTTLLLGWFLRKRYMCIVKFHGEDGPNETP